MLKKKITFIGSGAMAEAMISSLLRQNLTRPEDLCASDIHPERGQELHEKYGVQSFTDNNRAVEHADVVVLSVKPQRLTDVLSNLKGAIPAGAVVLSIVAGATIGKISKGLAHKAVVRSMPNTPAQIGEGITVWIASPSVSQVQKETARTILGAFGEEIYVDDENYLDMATALSGTGPAYVFIFMEAMIDAGVKMGLPRDRASLLATQTVKGTVTMLEAEKLHPTVMKEMITSPGGTTIAGLTHLEEKGFKGCLIRAIDEARKRAKELSA